MTKQLLMARASTEDELLRYNLRVYKAELDSCETPKDRIAILKKIADVNGQRLGKIKNANESGAISREEMQLANLRVYESELELIDASKDRIAILEKIVSVYKEMDNHMSQLGKLQKASQEDVREAKLSRLEAEIALEREKAKLVKASK